MAAFFSLCACLPAALADSPYNADLVVTGADIYTVDGARSWAHAMAVKDGKIIFVGDDRAVGEFIGPATEKLSLNGEMVLPGFHDSHVHPIDSGIELAHCRLDDAGSRAEVFDIIKKYVKEHPQSPWITGSGWSLPLFPDACPTRQELDALIPDRPAYFVSQDAHSAWVNSKALQLAHISRSTSNPPLGIIERTAGGEPAGTLRESATDLVSKIVPKPTREERQEGLLRALRMANGFGITSWQDASADEDSLKTYTELANWRRLTVRLVVALHVDPQRGPEQVSDFVGLRDKYLSPFVRPTAAKIFADGVVETHTAALSSPYTDKPETSGLLNFSTQRLNAIVEALDKNNFQVHTHAIGDAAVHQALDALELARSKNGLNDNRHHIAHLELIQPTDIPRFRKLNVVSNFQPFWAYRDAYITQCTEPLLGAERTGRLYQINSVMKTGAIVAAGSDWSVTTMNPLDAIQVAVTRKSLTDNSGPAWNADECVSLAQMIAAYTINGAYLNHQEKETGSIEVGKYADFVILNKNLFEIDPSTIHSVHVLRTYFKGQPVYKSDPEK